MSVTGKSCSVHEANKSMLQPRSLLVGVLK